MGIEIKELKIKFNVNSRQEPKTEENSTTLNNANYRKLIKECTDNVLKELERRIER